MLSPLPLTPRRIRRPFDEVESPESVGATVVRSLMDDPTATERLTETTPRFDEDPTAPSRVTTQPFEPERIEQDEQQSAEALPDTLHRISQTVQTSPEPSVQTPDLRDAIGLIVSKFGQGAQAGSSSTSGATASRGGGFRKESGVDRSGFDENKKRRSRMDDLSELVHGQLAAEDLTRSVQQAIATQSAEEADASYTPAADRMASVMNMGGVAEQPALSPREAAEAMYPGIGTRDPSMQKFLLGYLADDAPKEEPPGVLPSVSALPPLAHSEELADLRAQYERLREMYSSPVVNKNSRLKGAFKAAGLLLLDALASGQGLMGAAASALSGFVGGMAFKRLDEKIGRKRDIHQAEGQFGKSLKAADAMAAIETKFQRASAQGQPKALTPAQLATSRRGFSNFLAKFFPDGYKRGTREDVDKELDRLQMKPPPALPKKGGGGRPMVANPGQGVLVSDGSGGYTFIAPHGEEGESAPEMSSYQRKQLENESRRLVLEIGKYNTYRATRGLGPVTFDDWVAAGSPAAPAGESSQPAPSATPAPAPQPGSPQPQLVPSGAKPEAVTSLGIRSRGGRGRRGGGSSSGGGGGDAKYAQGVYGRINDLTRRAGEKRAQGFKDEADALDEQAERERATARKLYSNFIRLNSDGSADWKDQPKRQASERPRLTIPFLGNATQ